MSVPSNTEDWLDELLLEVRSDKYGDSGNYNEARLKAAIRTKVAELLQEAKLEQLRHDDELRRL